MLTVLLVAMLAQTGDCKPGRDCFVKSLETTGTRGAQGCAATLKAGALCLNTPSSANTIKYVPGTGGVDYTAGGAHRFLQGGSFGTINVAVVALQSDGYVSTMRILPSALGTCTQAIEGNITIVTGSGATRTKVCVCTWTPTGSVAAWVNLAANSSGTGVGTASTCP